MVRHLRPSLLALFAAGAALCAESVAHADAPSDVAVGMAVASPAQLDPSLGSGVGLSWVPLRLWQHGAMRLHAGGGLSWLRASEDTLSWQVEHDELRLAGLLEGRWRRGRGGLTARLGVGISAVFEARERHQSRRLEGGPFTTNGQALFGTVTFALGAEVRLVRSLYLGVSAGPAAHFGATGAGVGYAGGLEARWLVD